MTGKETITPSHFLSAISLLALTAGWGIALSKPALADVEFCVTTDFGIQLKQAESSIASKSERGQQGNKNLESTLINRLESPFSDQSNCDSQAADIYAGVGSQNSTDSAFHDKEFVSEDGSYELRGLFRIKSTDFKFPLSSYDSDSVADEPITNPVANSDGDEVKDAIIISVDTPQFSGTDEDDKIIVTENINNSLLDLKKGNDELNIKKGGSFGIIRMGSGNDTITIEKGGKFTSIDPGEGNDKISIENGGTFRDIDMGMGNNDLIIKGGGEFRSINMHGGNLTIENGGSFESVDIAYGNHDVVNIDGNSQFDIFDLRGEKGTLNLNSGEISLKTYLWLDANGTINVMPGATLIGRSSLIFDGADRDDEEYVLNVHGNVGDDDHISGNIHMSGLTAELNVDGKIYSEIFMMAKKNYLTVYGNALISGINLFDGGAINIKDNAAIISDYSLFYPKNGDITMTISGKGSFLSSIYSYSGDNGSRIVINILDDAKISGEISGDSPLTLNVHGDVSGGVSKPIELESGVLVGSGAISSTVLATSLPIYNEVYDYVQQGYENLRPTYKIRGEWFSQDSDVYVFGPNILLSEDEVSLLKTVKFTGSSETIGNFSANAPDKDNQLNLSGPVFMFSETNKVKAARVAEIYMYGDSNEIFLTGDSNGEIYLHGEENTIRAIDAAKVTAIGGRSTITLSASTSADIVLDGESSHLAANSVNSVLAGNGSDTIILDGDASGEIDLGGGSGGNSLTVRGNLAGNVESTGVGIDTVSIGGGSGNVSLGDGSNSVTIAGGEWSGSYIGGAGNDTITVGVGASASGVLSLGGGNNTIRAGGAVLSDILLMDGNDTVEGLEDGDWAYGLGEIDLGGGSNILRASRVISLQAGGGNDRVYLRPESGMAISSLDLGAGSNKLWIIGNSGSAASGAAVIPLSGDSTGGSNDSLYLCNETFAPGGCGLLPGGDYSYNIVLDASQRNDWETVKIGNQPSSIQSQVTIKGAVELLDPEFHDLLIAGDGQAGDVITVTGAYEILPPAGGLGTLFELDAGLQGGIHRSDELRFQGAERAIPAAPASRSPVSIATVRVRMASSETPQPDSRLNLVTVDSESDIEGVSLMGLSGGQISLEGHAWTFGKLDENGLTTYFLEYSDSAPALDHLIITGTGDTSGDVEVPQGVRRVTVAGDWSGNYTGLPGADSVTINSGVTASGQSWRLFGGRNLLVGSGSVLASVAMGDGDDTIGGFHATSPASDSGLVFGGPVDLGGGTNRMKAASAVSISAGDGSDTIALSGGASGAINLGGGATANSLAVGGLIEGAVTSAAAGPSGVWDTVSIGGGSGSVDLGDGDNSLVISGSWSGRYKGGSGADIITMDSGVSLSGLKLELGGGDNAIKGLGTIAAEVSLGDGDDEIGDFAPSAPSPGTGPVLSGAVNLGGGANRVNAVSATSVSGGDGSDTVLLSGQAGSVDLGGGANRLEAASLGGGYTGGNLEDRVILSGGAAGRIDLGGGASDNALHVGGHLEGDVYSSATGRDEVSIQGGAGDVELGGGENVLALSGGSWSGSYEGGSGADTITVMSSGEATGVSWSLGSGENLILGMGSVSAEVTLGDGDDEIGNTASGAPLSDNNLILEGTVRLGGGDNKVHAISAAGIFAGDGADLVVLSGDAGRVDLGGGLNEFHAGGINDGYSGGSGPDTVLVDGNADGAINLGGGLGKNYLRVSGFAKGGISSGSVGTGDTAEDDITVHGDFTGDARLGDGRNSSHVHGNWTGDYEGGSGVDSIWFDGASASGEWDLGGGNNKARVLGAFSGSITFGDGDDSVYGRFLDKVMLGDGHNLLEAISLASLTAGAGPDEIHLRPASDFTLPSMDLGGGDNSLLILGREGSPVSRQVTVPLSEIGGDSGANRLFLCNDGTLWGRGLRDSVECDVWAWPEEGEASHAFSVVIDATGQGEGAWESIKVGVLPSVFQSLLSVRGSVTLEDPAFNDFMLAADGVPGDKVTVTGAYRMLAPGSGRGTLFELDVTTGLVSRSDILSFEGASAARGQSFDGRDHVSIPSIALRASGDGTDPQDGSRVDIVTVDSASDVSGVLIEGMDSGGEIVLNGHVWSLSSDKSDEGSVYYLSYGQGSGVDRLVITGTGSTAGDVDLGGGINEVTVVGDWSGNYTGLDGIDDITVEAGVAASGDVWDLGEGDNALRGAGSVSARIVMGDGNDAIGDSAPDAPASALALSGALELGEGANRVQAASAASITGGEGPDTISLLGSASGFVDLGGGINSLRASGAASISGGSGADTVILSGAASGHVDLGGGANSLTASSAASYAGGSGADTVVLSGDVTGEIELGGGGADNSLEVGGLVNARVTSEATGRDEVLFHGGTGDIKLGGGANEVVLRNGSWSGEYEGGDGADRIWLSGGATASGNWNLGGGNNAIHTSQTVSGLITMGDGDDAIGDVSSYPALGRVILGGGSNRLSARLVESISGGSGSDSVYLMPTSDFTLSSLDLGGGENSMWVLGWHWSAEGRQVAIALSESGAGGPGLNRLYLCNAGPAATGCGSHSDDRAFNTALDTTRGGFWNSVKVGVEPSHFQSRLSVRGSVTLADPEFNDFMLAANGAAGDTVTVTGSYEMLVAASGRGTLFELDVAMGAALASDVLRFEGAVSVSGESSDGRELVSVPSIALRVSGDGSEPAARSRIDIVTVDSASDIAGVSVADVDPGGSIVLDGHAWSLLSETSGGATSYFLSYGAAEPDPPTPVDPGDGIDRRTVPGDQVAFDEDLDLGGGENHVLVTGDWAGGYTGLDGIDDITVEAGAAASGALWSLGGGANALRGSGAVSARVVMGDGGDTVGGFGPGASPVDSALAFTGTLELGGGANRVRAASAASITGGGDSDIVILSGAASGHINLGGGANSLSASSVAAYTGGPGKDTVILSGDATGHVDLGGGANSLSASGATSVSGGSGDDRVTLSGDASGHIDLGGGENRLEARGAARITGGSGPDTLVLLGSVSGPVSLGGGATDNILEIAGSVDGKVTSEATGRDAVSVGGGEGDIKLGGGTNELELSGAEWGGKYEGGDGPDTIRAGAASAPGDWDLGGGDNAILGSGWLLGRIEMGDGSDTVGSGSLHPALGRITLGGGENILHARSAESISGGAGPDRVYLRPDQAFGLSSLDLGGGENSLWLLGRGGDPAGRRAAIPLPAGGPVRLYLCNGAAAAAGCGSAGTADHAFHAALDATGGSWGPVTIGVEPSAFQSRLSVRGSVTLEDPRLSDFTLEGNGAPGDAVTITGAYEMLEFASGRGTLFELDVFTGSGTAAASSDTLRFEGASAAAGLSSDGRAFVSVPSISLRALGGGLEPPAQSRVDIVAVSGSDVASLSVAGADLDGQIVLDGHAWSLSSEASGGGTVFFLSYGLEIPDPDDGVQHLVITGTGDTAGDVNMGGGTNYVTVVGDWSGDYTGLDGIDDLTVEGGTTATGDVWDLGGGDNALRGAGAIGARVVMGDGGDTVGGFGPGARLSDSSLALSGGIALGDGENRVRAASAGAITGGADSDSVALSGAATGHVDLRGGTNSLRAASAVSYAGGPGRDTVTLSGGATGEISLGAGENRLEAAGAAGVTGLSGPDTVILDGAASGLVDLGGGLNRVEALSVDSFSGGAGSDTVILRGAILGHAGLGDGANRLEASGAVSIAGGSGPDTIILGGNATKAIGLGSGTSNNLLSVSGTIGGNVTSTATGKDEVSIGGGDGAVRLGGGENILSLSAGAWSGAYEGGAGVDAISIGAGASASGGWTLGDGADSLRGSGEASGEIDMGGGDDTVGNFAQGAPASDSALVLSGHLILGDGENRVRAISAAKITGGADPDTVILRGSASGHVDLGGGENRLEAAGINSYAGGSGPDTVIVEGGAEGAVSLGSGSNSLTVAGAIKGDVTSGPTGRDEVSIGGGTGSINLADGANALRLRGGAWSGTYDGGSDTDTILAAAGASASGEWKLEGGGDILRGSGEISGEVDMGAGDDVIGSFEADAPASDSALVFTGRLILGPGEDEVKAASAKSIEGTGGARIVLSGGASGAVSLSGGWNRLQAESAGSLELSGGESDILVREGVDLLALGDGKHRVEIGSVGEIVISCPAEGGSGPAAEPCGESKLVLGSVTGGISMSNHVSMYMSVNETIGGRVTSVSDTASDRIGFSGGEGDIDFGGGENELTLNRGVWSGSYTGGDGPDTIRVRRSAEMTGRLDLGGGDNVLASSGAISGEVRMGGGSDTVGGPLGAEAPGHLMSLSRIHLGDGENTVVARRAEALTAGSGVDRVALFPGSALEISELNLGGGDNELWIAGAAGDPISRRITIPLNGDGAGSGGGVLHICGETVAQAAGGGWGCADLDGAGHAINVALDASGGNAWGPARIQNQDSAVGSLLSVAGDVTLGDSRLGFLTVEGNGAAGDSLTMTGGYGIFPYERGLGTVFELDVDTAALAADTLRFESAARMDGAGFGGVAAVRVRAAPADEAPGAADGSRIDLVTVDADSDLSGVDIQGLHSGKITLNGDRWTFERETLESGTVYYLVINPDEATVSGGSEDMDFGNGSNSLTVTGPWSGNYTGGSGADTVTVESGAKAFGRLDFGGGGNALRGSGSVHGKIIMGDGDDTVGNPDQATAASGGALELLGHLDLGGGRNEVRVASAAGIVGGDGYDNVVLAGGSSGTVALGGGPRNRLEAGGAILGDATSAAEGEGGDRDHFVVAGVSGAVDMGGGENLLEATGKIGSYRGGAGNDTIVLGEGGKVLGSIALGGGENKVRGGPADDIVLLEGGQAAVDLGGGANSLTVSGAWRGSYVAKDGNDRFVSRSRLSVLESANLGGGSNTVIAFSAGNITAGSGNDQVTLAGQATGTIALGDGDDTLVLRGGAQADKGSFDLGPGANWILVEGAQEGASGITRLDLSTLKGDASLLICSGGAAVDPGKVGCARDYDGASGFSLALGGAGGFDTRIENADAAGQSLLSVSGDLAIQDSELGSLRIASEGSPGKTITLEGVQSFAANTVVSLAVSSGKSDLLEIKSTVREIVGDGWAKGPLVALRAVPGGGEAGGSQRRPIVRIDPGSNVEIRFADTFVFFNDDIWTIRDSEDGGTPGSGQRAREYYLEPEGIDLGEGAAAAQQALSASGAMTTSIATAAAAQARPGFTGSAGVGVSQDGPGQTGASFWTQVTMAEETERLRIGQKPSEFAQSLWVLNAGGEIYSHRAPGGGMSHSLIAQYGVSSSKGAGGSGRGLESTLSGVGYSLLYRADGGAYAQLSAMSSSISGKTGGEEYSLGGSSVSAEAGMAFATGGAGSMLTVSPLARLSLSEFGEVSLRSGDSSGIKRASAALGILADYETGAADGGRGARNLYGGVTVTQDLQGGFEFVPKDRDGNRTIAIPVDSSKTWVALEAGWAWSFGESGRAFVEASQASASGEGTGGERRSWTMGFDLSW